MKVLSLLASCVLIVSLACNSEEDKNSSGADSAQSSHDHGSHGHGNGSSDANLSDVATSMSSSFKVKGEWQSDELTAGSQDHSMHVMFMDNNGSMLSGVEIIEVIPWMVVHGHGSDTSQLTFQSMDGGHMFMISGLRFSMAGAAGDWEIRIKFSKDGMEDMVHLPVTMDVGS